MCTTAYAALACHGGERVIAMKKLLVLTDGKAGHENQSRAFARALGLPFDVATVRFKSRLHKILSYALSWMGIYSVRMFDADCGEGYSAVIGTGSGVFYAAKTLANKNGATCGVVLYPRGYDIRAFDCVLSPAFDRPRKAANVIEIPANLVANDGEFYACGVREFEKRHTGRTGRPAVAVVIGGPNKCSSMSPEWMRGELERIFRENAGGEFWVTTSRRTPADVENVVDSFPWDYKLIYSRDRFNPIPAFVALSDVLYVTAESTGMISEACTFGSAQVNVIDNLNPGRHKFRRFIEMLSEGGFIGGRKKVDLRESFAKAKSLLKV